ncbi:hypothetical protein EYC84_001266 [Monilinia fructicola]|uniref:Uncharacterized protein n=1 Tax=Monilinia fructicola TaxID=38448 RepID=A0A5M9JJJ5_MONFR|nr:hypothetical protein EYC84_001266 [Monilinia fructicola]
MLFIYPINLRKKKTPSEVPIIKRLETLFCNEVAPEKGGTCESPEGKDRTQSEPSSPKIFGFCKRLTVDLLGEIWLILIV